MFGRLGPPQNESATKMIVLDQFFSRPSFARADDAQEKEKKRPNKRHQKKTPVEEQRIKKRINTLKENTLKQWCAVEVSNL